MFTIELAPTLTALLITVMVMIILVLVTSPTAKELRRE